MEVKYQFSVAGLEGNVKGKLYQIVPVDTSQKQSPLHSDYHKVRTPMVEMPAMYSGDGVLENFLSRNIICPLIFKRQKASEKDLLIPEAIVAVTKKKRIVKTEVVGGSGTVKELIGDDDLDITITVGVVATDDEGYMIDEYPGKEMKEIQKFLDAKTIDIWSPFLQLFDIDGGTMKVVVESYDVIQSTHTNRQVITINAISDVDYTIFSEED